MRVTVRPHPVSGWEAGDKAGSLLMSAETGDYSRRGEDLPGVRRAVWFWMCTRMRMRQRWDVPPEGWRLVRRVVLESATGRRVYEPMNDRVYDNHTITATVLFQGNGGLHGTSGVTAQHSDYPEVALSSVSVDPNACQTHNHVPEGLFTWEPGRIGVWIDSNTWPCTGVPCHGTNFDAIVAGFTAWGLLNGRTYVFHSYAGTPPTTSTKTYVYVSQLRADDNNRMIDDPFGDGTHIVMPVEDWPVLLAQVANMRLATGLTASQYTASVAHEEGHSNGFWNCLSASLAPDGIGCEVDGSVMGSQNQREVGAPHAPTQCDVLLVQVIPDLHPLKRRGHDTKMATSPAARRLRN
jgi:hypothetical protein